MIRTIYHGSDRIIEKPLFGKGKPDNDYGSGFYTTEDKEKADAWALINGNEGSAITNIYELDDTGLNILNLDEYGSLSWIAEIIHNRGCRGEESQILGDKIDKIYKVDTSKADIIIGYRADDSYIDIVDAFLKNQVAIDEVERLFRKGELGQQLFIKSEKAFNAIRFVGIDKVIEKNEQSYDLQPRKEVSKFLKNRATDIFLHGYQPTGILARDVIADKYIYNKEYNFYMKAEPLKNKMEHNKKKGIGYDD